MKTLTAVDVDVWEERDRLSIIVTDPTTGETIAEWWDDDARQMFEDGFFDRRKLAASVAEYCRDVGLLNVKHSGGGKRGGLSTQHERLTAHAQRTKAKRKDIRHPNR